jgi:hypothetical protein
VRSRLSIDRKGDETFFQKLAITLRVLKFNFSLQSLPRNFCPGQTVRPFELILALIADLGGGTLHRELEVILMDSFQNSGSVELGPLGEGMRGWIRPTVAPFEFYCVLKFRYNAQF